jgi:L-fuconolactonase
VLRRDFLAGDLRGELASTGVDSAVTVQARQSVPETEWLLDIAAADDLIRGVVGWVPLIDSRVDALLERLCARTALKRVRHVLQAEHDDYMLRPGFLRGIGALARHGLAYDILILERQLRQAIRLTDRFPRQRFVLDHVAKPRIREGLLSPWRKRIPNSRAGRTSVASCPAWLQRRISRSGRRSNCGRTSKLCWKPSARSG